MEQGCCTSGDGGGTMLLQYLRSGGAVWHYFGSGEVVWRYVSSGGGVWGTGGRV